MMMRLGRIRRAVDDQLPLRDRAFALRRWRGGTPGGPRGLLELQFGGVFNGHDPLFFRDIARQNVQQRRLAGTCSTGDDNVQPRPHRALEQCKHRLA